MPAICYSLLSEKINGLFIGFIYLCGQEPHEVCHFHLFLFVISKCDLSFQLFSVIIFGCISSQGWTKDRTGKETCLYDGDSNACNYGVGISVIAFMASIGFIVGEYFFEQMSSIKTRKHYVMADMGFSGECMDQNFVFKRGLIIHVWEAFDELPLHEFSL